MKDSTLRVNGNKAQSSDAIYNLNGQRVGKSYKGVVVRNGSKFINK